MEVLGLASDTANTWVDQTTLHGVSPQRASILKMRPQKPIIIRKTNNLIYGSACNPGERKPVLYPRGQRRDIPSNTDLPTFPDMAATLGEPDLARSICARKPDGPVSEQ